MNPTAHTILLDIAEHPGTTVRQIANRLFITPQGIMYYLNGDLEHKVRRVQGNDRYNAAVYSVRDDLDWCPYCGRVME